jgi:hypothetical protein
LQDERKRLATEVTNLTTAIATGTVRSSVFEFEVAP